MFHTSDRDGCNASVDIVQDISKNYPVPKINAARQETDAKTCMVTKKRQRDTNISSSGISCLVTWPLRAIHKHTKQTRVQKKTADALPVYLQWLIVCTSCLMLLATSPSHLLVFQTQIVIPIAIIVLTKASSDDVEIIF